MTNVVSLKDFKDKKPSLKDKIIKESEGYDFEAIKKKNFEAKKQQEKARSEGNDKVTKKFGLKDPKKDK